MIYANYGLWASLLHYGLCACQNPQTIMQRKKKHVQESFKWSLSLRMDVSRTELEIQESRHLH